MSKLMFRIAGLLTASGSFLMLTASPQGAPVVQALVDVVRKAGQHQIKIDDIESHWIGDPKAYDTLLSLLNSDPADSQDWRNALQAIAIVSSGNSALAKQTFLELKKFATNDLRFHSTQPACTKEEEHCVQQRQIGYAAMLAKREAPNAIASIAKLSPALAPEIIQYLESSTTPIYWMDREWKWAPAPYYATATGRSIESAVLSLRSLASICTEESRLALGRIHERMKSPKPLSQELLKEHAHEALLNEMLAIPNECGPKFR